jgi:hypothetical protein
MFQRFARCRPTDMKVGEFLISHESRQKKISAIEGAPRLTLGTLVGSCRFLNCTKRRLLTNQNEWLGDYSFGL